jgi:hypothetical protein
MSEPVTNFSDLRKRGEGTGSREDALDLRIVQALERAPAVRIPEDFAARVAASIPARTVQLRQARPAGAAPTRRAAYVAAVVCLLVLAAAMLALAPHSAQRVFYQVLECLLAGQFCLLAAWVARPRGVSNNS